MRIKIFLCIIAFALLISACDFCIMGDACNEFWKESYKTTAEYGATQIHLQLKEIEKTQQP